MRGLFYSLKDTLLFKFQEFLMLCKDIRLDNAYNQLQVRPDNNKYR